MKIASLHNQTTALMENCNKIMAVCVRFFPFLFGQQQQGQQKSRKVLACVTGVIEEGEGEGVGVGARKKK